MFNSDSYNFNFGGVKGMNPIVISNTVWPVVGFLIREKGKDSLLAILDKLWNKGATFESSYLDFMTSRKLSSA